MNFQDYIDRMIVEERINERQNGVGNRGGKLIKSTSERRDQKKINRELLNAINQYAPAIGKKVSLGMNITSLIQQSNDETIAKQGDKNVTTIHKKP